ncbi:MAG: SEC-C domain-containing protein [Clostridia bacterium]|nr:SEC-C domain-containing protein [Clostridia bacterium]
MFEDMVSRIQRFTITRLLKTEWVFEQPKVPEAGEMMPTFHRPAPAPAPKAEQPVAEKPAAPTAEETAPVAKESAPKAEPAPKAEKPAPVFPVKEEGGVVDMSKLQTNIGNGPQRPAKAKAKIGPNEPCPCGSGKKYKKCCGKNS